MESGVEIRLYDPRRKPQDWTDLIRPTDCAVFLKDRTTSASLTPEGLPYRNQAETTCIVFDHLDAARLYCEARVKLLPHLRCEVYEEHGLARPPLLVVIHPDEQQKDDFGIEGSRRRKWFVGALLVASAPLFWIGARQGSDLAIFFGINCLLLALRFVYWDVGVRRLETERKRRVEEHRKKETKARSAGAD